MTMSSLPPELLPIVISLGVGLVVWGIGMLYLNVLQEREDSILRRFSGLQHLITAAHESRPSLRRDAPTSWWQRLLPSGLRSEVFAFSQEMRGLARLFFLLTVGLIALILNVSIGLHLIIGGSLGLALALIAWWYWVRMRQAKRLRLLDEAMPEALDMIVRTLRVGLPIGAAIQSVGHELTGPIAREFSEAADRISYGQPAAEALREMAERTENLSLRYLAAAVSIQSASGGNLAEVLERLAAVARGRQQMRRKIRSITAEAKWSGRFLSFFPVLATMMILTINPQYFSEISDEPFFPYLLAVVGGLLVLNVLFMRWLVKIE